MEVITICLTAFSGFTNMVQSKAEDGRHAAERSLSLPGTDVLSGDPSQLWDHLGITTGQQSSGFPSQPTTANKKHGKGDTRPHLTRPRPNFAEHFKSTGDICRQFLREVVAEIQKERRSLEDTRQYHHVIEAACFLRGRILASHTQDAGRAADKDLIQMTWDILQSHTPKLPSTHLTQADLDQLQVFLVGPSEVKTVISGINNVEMVAEHNTTPSTPARSFSDGVPTANTNTSLHSSCTDDQHVPFLAMAHGYSDQLAFPDLDCHQTQSQMFLPPLPRRTAELQFMPAAQTYIGPYTYPNIFDTYQSLPSGWQDDTHVYKFPGGQIDSEAPLIRTMGWDIDTQNQDASGPSDKPQTLLPDRRIVETVIATNVTRDKRNQAQSAQTKQPLKRSRVRRDARLWKHTATPKAIAPMASAPEKNSINDVFVDESPASVFNSPRERKRVTEGEGAEADVGITPVNYQFQRPIDARGIEGKSRNMLLMEGKLWRCGNS
jgi:hypothetical protein